MPQDLTADDVLEVTPKFWSVHLDPTFAFDCGLFSILAMLVNLTVGALARHLSSRSDLLPLVNDILKGDVIGLYLLTERGHGLDAINIETTAHQQEDGKLCPPHSMRGSYQVCSAVCCSFFGVYPPASRFMPVLNPTFGINKIAIVMAH